MSRWKCLCCGSNCLEVFFVIIFFVVLLFLYSAVMFAFWFYSGCGRIVIMKLCLGLSFSVNCWCFKFDLLMICFFFFFHRLDR
jgi:hypothetical protein